MPKRNRKRRDFASSGFVGLGLNEERNENTKRNDEASNKSKLPGVPVILLAVLLLSMVGLGAVTYFRSSKRASIAGASQSFFDPPPPAPPTMPANAPSKEFVYAGSALISTVEPFREPPDDLAVWRPSEGMWYVLNSSGQMSTEHWGELNDKPAPGDFDGDGKTDFSVYRPSTGVWWIIYSAGGGLQMTWGESGDIPVPADYDGDGRSDVAVWRPANFTWYIQASSQGYREEQWGASTDSPEPADFDGDGKADLTVWRNSTATFWVKQSTNGGAANYSIGQTGDEPVIGDYDGDGKADYAVRRTSDNIWRIRYSSDGSGSINSVWWGETADIAVPGRYNDAADTDSKTDVAVWRPSTGTWYIRRSSDLSMRQRIFGVTGDIPVPANWRR